MRHGIIKKPEGKKNMERSPPAKVVEKKVLVKEDQSVIDMYKYLGLTTIP